MTFETGIDKINLRIRAVYVSGRSDLGLRISPKECLMSASSVNTALQNGGNSNQSVLFTLKLRTLHCEERDFCVSVVAQTRTNVR